jgi:hypothetical protein
MLALLGGASFVAIGCGGSMNAAFTTPTPNPTGASYLMTVTATSGALTHATQVTLTVK